MTEHSQGSTQKAPPRHRTIYALAINAGRKCGAEARLQGLLAAATEICPQWAACFISEFDAYYGESPTPTWQTRAGETVRRHWPGEGSCSMAWVTRRGLHPRMRSCEWRGRAGRLTIGRSSARASLGPHEAPK